MDSRGELNKSLRLKNRHRLNGPVALSSGAPLHWYAVSYCSKMLLRDWPFSDTMRFAVLVAAWFSNQVEVWARVHWWGVVQIKQAIGKKMDFRARCSHCHVSERVISLRNYSDLITWMQIGGSLSCIALVLYCRNVLLYLRQSQSTVTYEQSLI